MVNLEIISYAIIWSTIVITIIATLGKATNTEEQTQEIIQLVVLIVGFPTLVIVIVNDLRVRLGYKPIRLKTINKVLDGAF